MVHLSLKNFKIKDHYITIIRRIVQITAFLLINYIIIQQIFLINFTSLEGYASFLPILQTPRSGLSNETGIVELIFFHIVQGTFPFLLIGIFILIILFANRSFCGWICPIGTIQDLLTALPIKTKRFKDKTHKSLLKLKFFIVILIILVVVPLGITIGSNIQFYNNYKENIVYIAEEPIGFFSLSEYLFVTFPNMAQSIWESGGLDPLFSSFWMGMSFLFYLIIIILSLWYPRFYCRYLCPVGAVCGTISDHSFLKISRSPVKCVGRQECGICEKVCPKQIRILDEPFEFFSGEGECNLCLKCMEKCPYKAIMLNFG